MKWLETHPLLWRAVLILYTAERTGGRLKPC